MTISTVCHTQRLLVEFLMPLLMATHANLNRQFWIETKSKPILYISCWKTYRSYRVLATLACNLFLLFLHDPLIPLLPFLLLVPLFFLFFLFSSSCSIYFAFVLPLNHVILYHLRQSCSARRPTRTMRTEEPHFSVHGLFACLSNFSPFYSCSSLFSYSFHVIHYCANFG